MDNKDSGCGDADCEAPNAGRENCPCLTKEAQDKLKAQIKDKAELEALRDYIINWDMCEMADFVEDICSKAEALSKAGEGN